MNIKQMLMASTAVLVLGGTALPASAQSPQPQFRVAQEAPPALMGAIQTYREAQAMRAEAEASGGDIAAADAALDSARTELTELCAAVGQSDIEACIAAFQGGGAPAPEAAPAAVEEMAPEVIEEEANVEAEAEAEAPVEEPAPEAEAPAEEPAPEAEEPAPEEPAAEPVAEPEVAQEEPAAEEQPAAEPQPEAETQAEPEAQPEPATDEQEQAQPEVEAEAEAEVDADAQSAEQDSGAPQSLLDAVQAYRDADSDDARIAAETEMLAICEAIGQPDLMACLAAFNIELEMAAPEGDAATEVDADAETAVEGEGEEVAPPPAEDPQPEPDMQDEIVLEDGDQGEIVPEGVNAEEVAPLLDSEKDNAAAQARGETEADADAEMEATSDVDADAEANAEAETQAEAEAEAPAEPVAAPTSDEEAQSQLTREDVISILNEEGQRREAQAAGNNGEPELIGRVESETPSNLEIITTIGLATVFAIGANQFIDAPDTPRIIDNDNYQDYYVEDLPRGRTRETILRADGSQLVTVRDRYGSVIRRSRIEPDGREILLVYVDENTQRYDDQGRWIDPARDLPPLRLNIPAREYVLDASYADQQQVETFLDQPPVESIQRYYTVDEVKRSSRVRDMVRRLEVGGLTFDTASANIPQQELSALSAVANAMLDLLEQNPAETFLIEGHTDAVGSDLSNLELSNLRAESVAYALTRVYGIPAENLATQGYGERYLKINTQGDERLNRRVTIRRITPLVTPVASNG